MNTSISEAKRILGKAKEKIKQSLANDKMLYESIFENANFYNINNNEVVISTDTCLAAKLLNTKYLVMVSDAVSEISETHFNIKFVHIDELKDLEDKENPKKDN